MAEAEEKKVVIAYDGSENSEYALDWYVHNMHQPRNKVTLVHVPELNDMLHSQGWATSVYVFDREVMESLLKKEHDRIQADLERFAKKLKSYGLGGKVKSVASNKPGEGIAREAEGASLVVVGSRGMGAVRRTLLGSVSDFLLHHCHCPVMVVKHPKHVEMHQQQEKEKEGKGDAGKKD